MTDIFTGISQEVISGIALGSIYALIALGFTMIYKATEVVNFAQGDVTVSYTHLTLPTILPV